MTFMCKCIFSTYHEKNTDTYHNLFDNVLDWRNSECSRKVSRGDKNAFRRGKSFDPWKFREKMFYLYNHALMRITRPKQRSKTTTKKKSTNSTPRRFPFYLLLTLLSYFLFSFYLSRFSKLNSKTVPVLPSLNPSLIFPI